MKNSLTHLRINVPLKIQTTLNNPSAEDCCVSVKVFGKIYFLCISSQLKCQAYNDQLMRIQYTLVSKCQSDRFMSSIIEGHPNIDYNQYIVNDANNGNWKGFAKVIKVTGKIPISLSPQYLEFSSSKQKLSIFEDSTLDKLV